MSTQNLSDFEERNHTQAIESLPRRHLFCLFLAAFTCLKTKNDDSWTVNLSMGDICEIPIQVYDNIFADEIAVLS